MINLLSGNFWMALLLVLLGIALLYASKNTPKMLKTFKKYLGFFGWILVALGILYFTVWQFVLQITFTRLHYVVAAIFIVAAIWWILFKNKKTK